LWSLLRALRRRLIPALVVGLLLAGIISTVAWFVIPPPKKTVRSLLQIHALQPKVFFDKSEGNQQQSFDFYQRSQVAILKSRWVLNAALDETVRAIDLLKDEPDPVQWLEKELKADFTLGPEILRITMEGDDSKGMETIINAVTKAYLDEAVNRERKKKMERLDVLKGIVKNYEDKTQSKREQLRLLARSAGSNRSELLVLSQQFMLGQLALARKDLATLTSEERKIQARLDLAEERFGPPADWYSAVLNGGPVSGLPVNLALSVLLQRHLKTVPAADGDVPESTLDDWFNQDLLIKKYTKRMKDVEGLIDSLKRVAANNDKKTPALLLMRQQELADARKSIEERRQALLPKGLEEIRQKGRALAQTSLYRLRQEKATVERLKIIIQKDIEVLEDKNKHLSESTLRVDDLTADIRRWEETSDRISREIDGLEVEQRAPERVTRMEEAYLYMPSKNVRQVLLTAVAGVATLALVLFGFAWSELRSRKVDSAEEVVRDLGITLMGTLPDFNRPRARWLSSKEADLYWENHLINSVDAVRTTILFAAREEKLKAVLVTSAVSGEGKTSSASHLAASLTRAGRKTVLVDCDLRNPSAHRLFELSRGPGFSELLRGESSLAEVTRPTNVDGLFLITAGQGDLEAIQALSQDRLGPIFQALREQFDFIVIDSSPILPVPDALLVAQYVDGVIFSILREVSRVPKILAAFHRLSFLQVRVLGAVVNGTRDETYGDTGYHYGYGMPAKADPETEAAETEGAEAAPPQAEPPKAEAAAESPETNANEAN
jgi:capsular exopolysaccharide synthesis family protein